MPLSLVSAWMKSFALRLLRKGSEKARGYSEWYFSNARLQKTASFLLSNSLLVCPPMHSEIQDIFIFPSVPWLVHIQLSQWPEVPMLLLFCFYSNHSRECYCDFAATAPLSEWSLAQKRHAPSYTDHGTSEHSQKNYKNCEIAHRKGLSESLCFQG